MTVDTTSRGASPTPRKAIWKRWHFWVGAVAALGVIGAIAEAVSGGGDGASDPTTAAEATTSSPTGSTGSLAPESTATSLATVTTTTSAAPSTTTTQASSTTTAEAGPHPVFGEGLWLVGDEIAPGLYQTLDGGDSCYWERLSGLGGTMDEIVANEIGHGQEVVEISASDVAFNSERCGEWYEIIAPDEPATTFGEGAVVVGVHAGPGTYAAPGGDGCYWARLSGFGGTMGEVIANDLPSGRAIVTISASDAGFRSNGCGTWEKTG